MSLHWFRMDLRLHDNTALLKAIESGSKLIPLYILDPDYLDSTLVGANRLEFLLKTLNSLDADLRKIGVTLLFISMILIHAFYKQH